MEKIYHIRVFDDLRDNALVAKGGATVVLDEVSSGLYHFGIAYCSHKDNFCRQTGREIALCDLHGIPGVVEFDWNREVDYHTNMSNLLSTILADESAAVPSKKWWEKVCPYYMSLGLVKSGVIVYANGPVDDEFEDDEYDDEPVYNEFDPECYCDSIPE